MIKGNGDIQQQPPPPPGIQPGNAWIMCSTVSTSIVISVSTVVFENRKCCSCLPAPLVWGSTGLAWSVSHLVQCYALLCLSPCCWWVSMFRFTIEHLNNSLIAYEGLHGWR